MVNNNNQNETVISSDDFIQRLDQIVTNSAPAQRTIIALAGPPAAGKTTLAQRAVDHLNNAHANATALVPMDGYHFDDELLVPRGWRPRKGAPHTFDVYGLASALQRLRLNEEPTVVVPRFDRELEIARAGAIAIDQSVSLVLVEGLYLLFEDEPWPILAPLFDITAMIQIDESEIRKRLQKRWTDYNMDADSIELKIEENDLPNARMVYSKSRSADWTIVNQ